MQTIEFIDYKSDLYGRNAKKNTYKNAFGNSGMILVLQNGVIRYMRGFDILQGKINTHSTPAKSGVGISLPVVKRRQSDAPASFLLSQA